MSRSATDPYLPPARAAAAEFKAGTMTAEQALAAIWAAMNLAAAAGHITAPYVRLSDAVTFPEEKHDVDPEAERQAAEWMDELKTRESFDE